MTLPDPIPDDPTKWEGWRNYNSGNLYERLCLHFEENPTTSQIEDHCRRLLVWWQKKLPLKNQPSNPIAAMLRAGLDEAPHYLSQARAELLNPESRQRFDSVLRSKLRERAQAEFLKFLSFSIARGVLSKDAEEQLLALGIEQGLSREDIVNLIDHELAMAGAVRQSEPLQQQDAASQTSPRSTSADPEKEFIRVLNMAGLESGEMTDDQRDAFVNIAENLGIEPAHAEDMIDDWIEQQENAMFGAVAIKAPPIPNKGHAAPLSSVTSPAKPSVSFSSSHQPSPPKPHPPGPPTKATSKVVPLHIEPDMEPEEEKRCFPNFCTQSGIDLVLIPSGCFIMGSVGVGSTPDEAPEHKVYLTRFYLARLPVTNLQYELFDPSHRSRRPPWADDMHPVVYVSSLDAIRFCEWLSAKEGRKFRLPTEAEWEFAARGEDNRLFPWGNQFDGGDLANFADRRTNFAWSDRRVDDGFAETSPVGSYPRGASAFGILDMAGNVWEWCQDFYAPYSNKEQKDPAGSHSGSKRIYRGGSWRSRISSLRCSARSFNSPTYTFNDVGFRVACACR